MVRVSLSPSIFCMALAGLNLHCGDGNSQNTADAGNISPDAAERTDSGTINQQDAGIADSGAPDMGTISWPECIQQAQFTGPVMPSGGLPRCGQNNYQWSTDPSLGKAIKKGRRIVATLDTLRRTGTGRLLGPSLKHDVTAEQIEYQTQDRGQLVTASAVIAYPQLSEAEDALGIVIWNHGTSGFTSSCAPSLENAGYSFPAVLASMGYVAVAPDYIGLNALTSTAGKHAYLVGEQAAISALDAARAAALEVGQVICVPPDLAIIGASQGGHAALFADLLQPYYAPEFRMRGTVAIVPPSDLENQFIRALEQRVPATSNALSTFYTASSWYDRDPAETFLPDALTNVEDAFANSCQPSSQLRIGDANTLFRADFLQGFTESSHPMRCILQDNSLAQTSWVQDLSKRDSSYGILSIYGEADSTVDITIERASWQEMCKKNYRLNFVSCQGAGHGQVSSTNLLRITDFIGRRFDGETFEPASSCVPPVAIDCSAN